MPQVALHTVLEPDRGGDYDRVHRTIPAELARALREHGVTDWRIWRDGTDVFHLVDVEDYAAMRNGLRDLPANQSWQETVGPLFDVPDSYAGDDAGIGFVWSLQAQLGDPGRDG